MNLKDVPAGTRVVQIENMREEVRYTFYERAAGVGKHFPERNVKVFGVGLTQGIPGEPPRYVRVGYRRESEAHRFLPVEVDDGSFSYRPEQSTEDVVAASKAE